jgi:hypothetical protein
MREFFRMLMQRAAALFRRRRLEDDLDEELRSHLEMAIELNLRKGMSAEDARREALRNFGGVEQTKENYQSEPARPAGVRVGVCGDDDYGFGSEFFASLAGNAHPIRRGRCGIETRRPKLNFYQEVFLSA